MVTMYGAVDRAPGAGVKGPETRPAFRAGSAVVVVSAGRHPVLWVGKAAVVSAPAQIDVGNVDDVLVCMLSVIREGPAALIVDMTATTFCDCAGVNGLVQAFKQARASGVEMRLAVSGPAVRRVLDITGAGRLIGTYPTVPESLVGGLAPAGGSDHPNGGPARVAGPA
jgi:anti-anti-sigma factor